MLGKSYLLLELNIHDQLLYKYAIIVPRGKRIKIVVLLDRQKGLHVTKGRRWVKA